MRLAASCALVVLGAMSLPAQSPAPAPSAAPAPARLTRAARRTSPVTLDGRLDDAAWAAAPATSGFTQAYPSPDTPAADSTQVRVLYDDQALYVGIRMFDAHPDSIAAGLARRDATAATGIYSDWVHLIIDSYHDRRTAFRFSTTPRGVQKDVYSYNDGGEDLNWDAVWEVVSRVDSLGWVAEYRIPLSQLRYGSASAGAERVWGFQVMRDIARRNERTTWAPWNPKDGAFVSRFGDLAGLVGLHAPERLEVMPYVSSQVTSAPGNPANPFYQHTRHRPSVGGDLKYGLPGGLTLSATINPDFGQVEVDPAVVNLSAFETSFPEKRPFFLEGSDVFGFGQVVRQNDYGSQTYLYSRRIGRPPQRGVGGGTVRFVDAPLQATIAGAAKITGKSGPWTVGILEAVTTEQRARVFTTTGESYDTPVEPLTNYFAGRLKRDFRGGATTVGTMVERTARALRDSVFVPLLRSDATFGGVDFEHDMRKRSWIVSGFLAGSDVRGSAQAIAAAQRSPTHYFQRPDAGHLELDSTRTALRGYIGELALARNGATFGSVAYKESSPGLELNDLGQQNRTDFRALSTLIGHQSYTAGKRLRSYTSYLYQNAAWNFGGSPIYRGYAGGAHATFLNMWNVDASAGVAPRSYDDRLLRGGPQALLPSSWNASAGVGTDSRSRVVGSLSGSYSRDEAGSWSRGTSVGVDVRPSSTVHLSFSPNLRVQHSTAQFVRSVSDPLATATFGRRYVFADLDQRTLSLDTRVDLTLSPALSFVMYAQPFVSSGRYARLKEFLAPDGYAFVEYPMDGVSGSYDPANKTYTIDPDGAGAAPSFTVDDPNFRLRSLRGNAVVRWDYRPGSSLFFVWQQRRGDFEQVGEFEARRDVQAIFRTVPTNVFLLKATYWMGR